MRNQYKSYEETGEFLHQMQKKHPSLIKVESIGKTWEDRDIFLATLSRDVENAHKKPALFFTGTIHAREWIGHELAIEFIEYVVANNEFDPRLDMILDKCTIYLVPCANPDGFEYSRNHFTFWRKNRRDNKNGTYGVDLNRNFSVGFVKSKDTSSNVYGGPEPFSEPETRAIKEFVDSHPNITIALDYHSQGNVFFPAHKFSHEAEMDGTDLNTLCANMANEIRKVSGREYGIHRGKPPAKLISGSGREYYYSRGILAVVAEVGTRNVPDYMINMQESIAENIPALLYAFKEVENYSSYAPKRPKTFELNEVASTFVSLKWTHEVENGDDVYYEIYRNTREKQACNNENLIVRTRITNYTDTHLEPSCEYFYYLRAVNKKTKVKSPFAPRLHVRTLLERDEFSKTIFPALKDVGYVGEFTLEQNAQHFGNNSMFVGIDQARGVCYGVIGFSLANIPQNAIIKSATLSLYPMNRVGVTIEKYGEWSAGIIDQETIGDIRDYDHVEKAHILHTLGQTIASEEITQGIWHAWNFNDVSCSYLQGQILKKSVYFKLRGPKSLPLGRNRQMMQFDIGYGKFGGGIHYRPVLDIVYTLPSAEVRLSPTIISTVRKDETIANKLSCGFDKEGNEVFGLMKFDLSSLPDPNQTVITQAYIKLSNKNTPKSKQDIRYNMEFIDLSDEGYKNVASRETIEYVGYELSRAELLRETKHHFIFDLFSRLEIEKAQKKNQDITILLHATSAKGAKSSVVRWYENSKDMIPTLVICYVHKRKFPLATPENFRHTLENGIIKLAWDKLKDKELNGYFVVRNRFHPPHTPYDGVKLYGGSDAFTYDNFGSTKIEKYFAVFSYDIVPNFSKPAIIHYKP